MGPGKIATEGKSRAAEALAVLLEKHAEKAGSDPRLPFLLGLAKLKSGQDGFPWLARAVEAARGVEGGADVTGAAARIMAEVSVIAAARDRQDLLASAAEAYLGLALKTSLPLAEIVWRRDLNPVYLHGQALARQGRHYDLYRLLSRAIPDLVGGPNLTRSVFASVPPQEFAKDVLSRIRSAEEHMKLAEVVREYLGHLGPAAEALEKGPREPGLLLMLARYRARGRQLEKAEEAARAAHAAKRSESSGLLLVRLLAVLGRADEARALLGELEREFGAGSARLSHYAELRERVGEFEASIALYGKAMSRGDRPHFQLGRLLARTGKDEEAVRFYNRDLDGGSIVAPWPEDDEVPYGEDLYPSGPYTSGDGKAAILLKLGENHFLDRMWARRHEPPGEARASVEKLVRGDDAARGQAEREILAFGENAAPLLKPLLGSPDDALRMRARSILSRWAEPR